MRSRSCRRNALAVVVHDDLADSPVAPRSDRDAFACVANRIVEQVPRELAQPPFVAVDDRARGRALETDSARASRSAASRAMNSATTAPRSTGSQWSAPRPGSRASVSRSVTTAEASSALRAMASKAAGASCGRARARRLCDRGNRRKRRAQFVRGVGGEDALALARRLERCDRRAREHIRRDGDDCDERHVERRKRHKRRGASPQQARAILRACRARARAATAYSRAINAYAPALSARSTQTKIAEIECRGAKRSTRF